jgi:Tol biopolymer transport system component
VNTAAYEDGARLSSDGRRLFFSSTRPLPGDESANVYSIDIGDLLDPPRPAR